MKTSEILADARDRIDRGWCKNLGIDAFGNVCAVGAISLAESAAIERGACREDLEIFPYDALMVAITDSYGSFYGTSVPAFNDDPVTTKQDVLNAFDKAICSLEEKGL